MLPVISSTIGLCGSLTSACLFLPQVWVSHRTKQTQQIAWTSVFVGLLNAIFWTSYGFLKHDPFIYVTNILCFCGAFLLFLLKKRHG
ncbi:MAG TPA: SemiSWEET family transporter [Candidatus Saccharimonadales bacterium]|nr:SemiSWEET family transporter [Candidatus Saccharimonadales bacterium]